MDLTAAVQQGELLSFEERDDHEFGLEIIDNIERRRCSITTPTPVRLQEITENQFEFPVDRGRSFTAESITLQHCVPVCVRNHAGWMVAELASGESREFPPDQYSIDFSAPVKLFASFEAAVSIDVSTDSVTLEFDEPVDISLGARSHHKSPAATITTTTAPEDVMKAVSYFGSALKTSSPERSYPSLRGHPPAIEIGDRFHAPAILETPDTGITIEVPPDLQAIAIVSPLAFYLGAELVEGEEPRLRTDTGYTHSLQPPDFEFEEKAQRVLKQCFFLDCVTRTEGYYPVNLHERNAIEDRVDLNFEALYEDTLARQVEAYLSVPYDVVEAHVPQWKLTAYVDPTPENLETLPFLLNDLAVIRSVRGETVTESEAAEEGLEDFFRGRGKTPAIDPDTTRAMTVQGFTRSAGDPAEDRDALSPVRNAGVDPDDTAGDESPQLYRVDESDALEQTWISDGVPIGASKGMPEAFRNSVQRSTTTGDIEITVICNSEEMEAEEDDLVDAVYGSRDDLPFDVEVHQQISTAELRQILQEETDFLHYIGHIDANGFECRDGMLDATELESTGVDAFFLNACSSYQQGKRLIEAGAIAGVVTFADVINSGAERVGKTLARLLNRGFPLRVALDIAKRESIMGGYYLVIGEGNFDIAQADAGLPNLCEIRGESEPFELTPKSFVNSNRGMGTLAIAYIEDNNEYYIAPGACGDFSLAKEQVQDYLEKQALPFYFRNQLHWSDEENFTDLLRT